jgi:hypothetical protein
MMNVS